MGVWDFIQNQILGMKWLNGLIGRGLSALGLDVGTRLGGSVQFFIYDVMKITILLCTLIFVISYIQSYFPPERSKRILGRFHGMGGEYGLCIAWYGDPLLLLLLHSPFHGLHQRRAASWRDLLLFDFLTYGGPGKSCAAHEHFRRKGGHHHGKHQSEHIIWQTQSLNNGRRDWVSKIGRQMKQGHCREKEEKANSIFHYLLPFELCEGDGNNVLIDCTGRKMNEMCLFGNIFHISTVRRQAYPRFNADIVRVSFGGVPQA